ncbi:DUF6660 family protein [uncultured Aquimarina sp.]|uniref:DUF6660 family protein n=1 Tax=uncultured Aquimarina sp. TaxID=575652 RepID=UPI00261BDCC5|nr:DUF6660 family protein [uncultured Aquimarina sp.]
MRFFCVLLSIFIVGLTIKPCEDAFEINEEGKFSFYGDHDHSHDEEDSCSELCICLCCGVTITYELQKQYVLEIKPEIISKDDFTIQPQYIYHFLSDIWQPPRFMS